MEKIDRDRKYQMSEQDRKDWKEITDALEEQRQREEKKSYEKRMSTPISMFDKDDRNNK